MSYKAKGLPWGNGIGTDVSTCSSIYEVMTKANLNYNVTKCELMAKMPLSLNGDNTVDERYNEFMYNGDIYRTCPSAYATFRTDRNIPLGVVKEKYEVVQNIDAFSFLEGVIGNGKDTVFDKAGVIGYGERIFISAKLPVQYKLDINGYKDEVHNYIVLANSHDGSMAINILLTPIRMFCINMLNAAEDSADSYIRIRHTKSDNERLEMGQEAIKIACENSKNAYYIYDKLCKININDDSAISQICELVLSKDEYYAVANYHNIGQGPSNYGFNKLIQKDYQLLEYADVSTRKVNQIISIIDYYFNGVEQKRIVGTGWGLYNAITGYYSNVANLEGAKRLNSLLYDNANKKMLTAMNSILDNAA